MISRGLLGRRGAGRGGFRGCSKSEGRKEEGRKEDTTGTCAVDDERYAAGTSREGVQAGRGGSANVIGMGARHRQAVWRGRQDAPTPAPPTLVFFSGRFPVASIAPTQRLHFLLFTSSSPGPRSRPIAFTDTHTGRPLPSLRHPVRDLICGRVFGSSGSQAGARVILPHSPQRAQDDGTAHEPRAGVLAVDARDGGLVHYTPDPALRVLPAGFPIITLYMQIPGMSSSARRTVFLGADFAQYDAESSVWSPSRLVPRQTHAPASGSFGGASAAHSEFSQLSYITRSSPPCTASDSPPVPRTPCSRRSFRRRPPIPRTHSPDSSSRRPHHLFLIARVT
ncbi:hypothetical protein B0H14DRAFT_177094 [Mycena olivaceomarginata]|nr:hypothetical protein B0H14DRAFT_177094 [Mycena olivaceomarginata]